MLCLAPPFVVGCLLPGVVCLLSSACCQGVWHVVLALDVAWQAAKEQQAKAQQQVVSPQQGMPQQQQQVMLPEQVVSEQLEGFLLMVSVRGGML